MKKLVFLLALALGVSAQADVLPAVNGQILTGHRMDGYDIKLSTVIGHQFDVGEGEHDEIDQTVAVNADGSFSLPSVTTAVPGNDEDLLVTVTLVNRTNAKDAAVLFNSTGGDLLSDYASILQTFRVRETLHPVAIRVNNGVGSLNQYVQRIVDSHPELKKHLSFVRNLKVRFDGSFGTGSKFARTLDELNFSGNPGERGASASAKPNLNDILCMDCAALRQQGPTVLNVAGQTELFSDGIVANDLFKEQVFGELLLVFEDGDSMNQPRINDEFPGSRVAQIWLVGLDALAPVATGQTTVDINLPAPAATKYELFEIQSRKQRGQPDDLVWVSDKGLVVNPKLMKK